MTAKRTRPGATGQLLRRTALTIMSVLLITGLAACDALLEADLPSNLSSSDLDDPGIQRVLVLGVQSQFDCALGAWIRITGAWNGDLDEISTFFAYNNTSTRQPAVTGYNGVCHVSGTPLPAGVWLPFHISRGQAEDAIRRLEELPEGAVPDSDLLIATSYAYAGYSILHLAEGFCEMYFDGGPRVTREESWRMAEERFTSALEYADRAASGSDPAEARSIRNMALVGRARALLNLGDASGVARDASEVDPGFVRSTDHSGIDARRRNNVYFYMSEEDYRFSVPESYHDLEVDGVPDPRVEVSFVGLGVGSDQRSPVYAQHKYSSESDPIPFSSWREARLMEAEALGGVDAVNIINDLRATVSELPWVDDSHPGLPAYGGGTDAEILDTVREERRRELWLQGARFGDMLRLDIPFPTGLTIKGNPIFEGLDTCYPTLDAERIANPNAS